MTDQISEALVVELKRELEDGTLLVHESGACCKSEEFLVLCTLDVVQLSVFD